MRRRLFAILSALSLVVAVVTCVLWVRSYKIAYLPTFLHLNSSNRLVIATQTDLVSVNGRVGVWISRVWFYKDIADETQCEIGKVVCVSDETTGTVSPQQPGWTWEEDDLSTSRTHYDDSGFGFDWIHRARTNPSYGWYSVTGATAPYWFLLLLFLIAPSVWMIRRRQENNRVRKDHCLRCGYDLRATPHQCPECGTVRTKTIA